MRGVAGQEGSRSEGRALEVGTSPLSADVRADTVLMCNERDGRKIVLDEPRVKGSPKPSGTPLHVQVVTRSAASTDTRRSSVQYTSSAAPRHGSGGLFPAENTCRQTQHSYRNEFPLSVSESFLLASMSHNVMTATILWTERGGLGGTPDTPGHDGKSAKTKHVQMRDSLPYREFPIQNSESTHPQAVHRRCWTENR